MNHKQFKVIPTNVVFEPDKVYDTYVNIDRNLHININIYKGRPPLELEATRRGSFARSFEISPLRSKKHVHFKKL